jgi:hypothetical protein
METMRCDEQGLAAAVNWKRVSIAALGFGLLTLTLAKAGALATSRAIKTGEGDFIESCPFLRGHTNRARPHHELGKAE